MLVLGLQGSPRRKGNSAALLSAFMETAESLGAKTRTIEVDRANILPCKEYVVCEKRGYCPIEDDVKDEIYGLIREAEIIVAVSPVFFYNVTAQLKALIDRCQTLWARKYRLKLSDPKKNMRRGFFMSVGATAGKNLFEGLELTAKYFFDAVDAKYEGSLTYREIEGPRDIKNHPVAKDEARAAASRLMKSFSGRRKILFASSENACRGQMAAAFSHKLAGDRVDAVSAGSEPAAAVNSEMVRAMQEIGVDMAFLRPQSLAAVNNGWVPDLFISMGGEVKWPLSPGTKKLEWDIQDPAGCSFEEMVRLRNEIEKRVDDLVRTM